MKSLQAVPNCHLTSQSSAYIIDGSSQYTIHQRFTSYIIDGPSQYSIHYRWLLTIHYTSAVYIIHDGSRYDTYIHTKYIILNALHCTLHFIVIHFIAVHFIVVHFIAVHFITVYFIAVHCFFGCISVHFCLQSIAM